MTTPTEPRARTSHGEVSGRFKDELIAFRGLPYAAPPVAELRFRAPQPVTPWEGVRDASEFGPVPPQAKSSIPLTGNRARKQSEDCLQLNVLTADLEPDSRPVVVHLHSGSYVPGSVSVPPFDGDALVRSGGVVYVSVNHRVGALGWLNLGEYSTPERPLESNLALRDQVAALTWVRDNIDQFGGDPRNVTVLGASMGATAVTTLLCVPAAAGLFHRAIAQSPAPLSAQSSEVSAEWGRAFIDFLTKADDAVTSPADVAALLDSVSTNDIVAASEKLTAYVPAERPGTFWASATIDDFLPEDPAVVFAEGRSHQVPLLIGTARNEGAAFAISRPAVLPDTTERVDLMFEISDPAARYRVVPAYPGYPNRRARFQLAGDALFWIPSSRVAAWHGAHTPTFSYRFDFTTPALNLVNMAATHGGELVPVFGLAETAAGRTMSALGGSRDLQSLSNRMQMHWLSFMRTGAPRADWPRYDVVDRATKVFAVSDQTISDPGASRRRAWNH